MNAMIIRSVKKWGVALAVMAVVVAPARVANAAAGDAGSRPLFAEQARSAGLDDRQARLLQDEVTKALTGMKVGGQQVSANEIVSDDGRVRVVVPLPGEERARPLSQTGAPAGCPYETLCLYDNDDFRGLLLQIWTGSAPQGCGEFTNLGDYPMNDRLESYDNNQLAGRKASFYNWENQWVYKFGSVAPHSDPNLNRWAGAANMIDGLYPC